MALLVHRLLEQEEPALRARKDLEKARWWNCSQVAPRSQLARLCCPLLLAPPTPTQHVSSTGMSSVFLCLCKMSRNCFCFFVPLVPHSGSCTGTRLAELGSHVRESSQEEAKSWLQLRLLQEQIPREVQSFPSTDGGSMLDSHKQASLVIPTYILV